MMHKDAMSVVTLRLGLLAFCKHLGWGCQWGAWCEDVGIRHQGQSCFRNEHTSCLPASSPWGPEAQVSKEKHPVHPSRTQMVCRGKPATWSVSGSNVAAPACSGGPVCTFTLPHHLPYSQEFWTWLTWTQKGMPGFFGALGDKDTMGMQWLKHQLPGCLSLKLGNEELFILP